jgi:hypothetical protein
VYINGEGLFENSTITVNYASSGRAIYTVHRGYAGEVLGALTTNVTVESAVPDSGFEFEPSSYIKGLVPVTFTIVSAGTEWNFDGSITQGTLQYSGTLSKLMFQARGEFISVA